MKDDKELNTQGAGMFAVAAILDAQKRNSNGKSHFTSAQILRADRALVGLSSCYGEPAREAMVNYRPGKTTSASPCKFIALKIFTTTVRDRKSLRYLEDGLEKDTSLKRVSKRRTAGGEIIYRLYF